MIVTPTSLGRLLLHGLASLGVVVIVSVAIGFVPNNGPLRAIEMVLMFTAGLVMLRNALSALVATVALTMVTHKHSCAIVITSDGRISAVCRPAFALGLTTAPRRPGSGKPAEAAVQLAAARMFSEAFSSRSMTSPQNAHE